MKKLIAIRGDKNSGKTTSIRKAFEQLKAVYPDAHIGPSRGRVEVTAIIKINGVKVGIESRGDLARIIASSLNEFEKAGCKIIVCACRLSGMTLSAVCDFTEAHYFDVEWIDKEKGPIGNQAAHETANNTMAAQIVSAVQAALGT